MKAVSSWCISDCSHSRTRLTTLYTVCQSVSTSSHIFLALPSFRPDYFNEIHAIYHAHLKKKTTDLHDVTQQQNDRATETKGDADVSLKCIKAKWEFCCHFEMQIWFTGSTFINMLQVQVSGRISAVAFYWRKAILFGCFHPKTRNCCWSHGFLANNMKRVRPSEEFLPPFLSWHRTGSTFL